MVLKRRAGLKGIPYRGGMNHLSWLLHRWSGLGIIIFVALHMLASLSTQEFGSTSLANFINTVYMSVYFQLVVAFIVYFHALQGLRIIMLDFFPRFLDYQREITYAQWLIFIPLFGMTAMIMLLAHFSGG